MKTILSKTVIKNQTLKNRLAVAPMTRVTATESGLATQTMRDYYRRFAKGGFGLIISEGLYTDQAYSQGYLFQPGLADDEQAQSWAPVTADAHEYGALVFAQLMHAGALSQGNRFRADTVAPSAVRPVGRQMDFYYGDGEYPVPKQITEPEIQEVIRGFADAAVRAVQVAGFDGIEIHGANGYLLDQFLTAHTNLRADQWGASQRVRLIVDVIQAVKAAVGAEVPVGVRISQGKVNDFTHKWPGGAGDAEVIFGALQAAGADFIHVTEFEAWAAAFAGGTESLLSLARRFAPLVALIVNGSLHDRQRAEQLLAAGADVLAIGRGALANPDLPERWAVGEELREFDRAILGPIANIKPVELADGCVGDSRALPGRDPAGETSR